MSDRSPVCICGPASEEGTFVVNAACALHGDGIHRSFVPDIGSLVESPAPGGTETTRCEACDAGMRLAPDGIHYDESRGGVTWGVCRKVIASIRDEIEAPAASRLVRTERAEELVQSFRSAAMADSADSDDDVIDQIAFDYKRWMDAMQAIKDAESWPPLSFPSMSDRWVYAALFQQLRDAEAKSASLVGARAPQGWQAALDKMRTRVSNWLCAESGEETEGAIELLHDVEIVLGAAVSAPPDRSPRVSGAQEEQ
jgi:hypothetical protein